MNESSVHVWTRVSWLTVFPFSCYLYLQVAGSCIVGRALSRNYQYFYHHYHTVSVAPSIAHCRLFAANQAVLLLPLLLPHKCRNQQVNIPNGWCMLMRRSSLLFLVLKVKLVFVIVQVWVVVVHKVYLSVVVGIQFSNINLYIDFQISSSRWKIDWKSFLKLVKSYCVVGV